MDISPALEAAQQLLFKRRAQHGARRRHQDASNKSVADGRHTAVPSPAPLPPHLGWNSSNVTRVLRQQLWQRPEHDRAETDSPSIEFDADPKQQLLPQHQQIVIDPDLALALLKQNHVAAGRLWYLLRALDETGRGVIEINDARQLLCGKDSKWRTCGWRQLRNLLRAGNNIFWQRDKTRIWLRSAAKVAAQLDVSHFTLRPVRLPASKLLGTIGKVRAFFYATFHSSRRETPIARATIADVSSVSASSQRNYERRAAISSQAQYVIGQIADDQSLREAYWRYGRASLRFRDGNGHHGPAGAQYVARRLPNLYSRPYPLLSKRRNRRLNKQLLDLSDQGTTGNEQLPNNRRYCQHAKQAVTQAASALYPSGRANVWYELS